jgi:hypothetical protein
MDVFKSVFSSKLKCTGCDSKIPPYKKRRKCKVCSILHLENLFCRKCSVKVKHPKLGYLWSRRYCIPCYNLLSQETVTTSQASSPQPKKRRGLNACRSMPDITIYNSEPEEVHKPNGLPTNRSVISS